MTAFTDPVADLRPFIGNRRADPASDVTLDLIDPATRIRTAGYAASGADAVAAAIAAGRAALAGPWGRMGPVDRMAVLNRLADLMDANRERLALCDRLDIGKPIANARFEVGIASGYVRYYAEAIDKADVGAISPTGAGAMEYRIRRPRGIIAAIIPWNFPVINMGLKIGPMLAAGNSVIVKPSELSPRSALLVAELAAEAGLPEGALSVLPGAGATGDMLARHHGVDMIAFTGSTGTGKALMRAIGETSLKPILLECGGKSPEIVFEDMAGHDLDAIAAQIVGYAYFNQGQLCVARTRLYIQDALYQPLIDRIVARASTLKAGDPDKDDTSFGPLASGRQQAVVERFIASGIADGAELLLDGRGTAAFDGHYVEPTIFAVNGCEIGIAREEIFGPVLSVARFTDEADAIRLANATEYGLAASVWTGNLGRAQRMSLALETGNVRIFARPGQNEAAGYAHASEPAKQSGFGIEGGLQALESFSRLQAVELHY